MSSVLKLSLLRVRGAVQPALAPRKYTSHLADITLEASTRSGTRDAVQHVLGLGACTHALRGCSDAGDHARARGSRCERTDRRGRARKARLAGIFPLNGRKYCHACQARRTQEQSASHQRAHHARVRDLPSDRAYLAPDLLRPRTGRASRIDDTLAQRFRHRAAGVCAAGALLQRAVVDLRAALPSPDAMGMVSARTRPFAYRCC